jgi:hypothetical protein
MPSAPWRDIFSKLLRQRQHEEELVFAVRQISVKIDEVAAEMCSSCHAFVAGGEAAAAFRRQHVDPAIDDA